MTGLVTGSRTALHRLLDPQSIAIVGLSDSATRMLRDLRSTFEAGCEIFIVNPRYDHVAGRPTVSSLSDLGRPVDCVFSVMGVERTTELAEEAAALDIGGMVVVANGFAEVGGEGIRLQERLRSAATSGGFAVIGPNGLGLENVPRGIRLSVAVKETHNPGGISIVSQSGAALTGITMTGNAAGAGFNLLISAGNEAVSDLADFVDYLANDPATKTIGLVIEKIRRPAHFFAAVRRAVAAGKPVVAVKLARSERTQRMAVSHTGSLTGDARVYDVALQQLGVSLARDTEEAADRLALIDKIPRDRWTTVQALGIVTRTGGIASLSCDIAGEEGIPVPPLADLLPWLREWIPSLAVPNPLDTAGGGGEHFGEIVERFVSSPEVDAFLVPTPMSEEEDHARSLVTDVAAAARLVKKPVVIANVYGLPPSWAREYESGELAFGRGIRQSLRGLQTIGSFVRHRAARRPEPQPAQPIARPAVEAISTAGAEMLPFEATMRLLREFALPVAPYLLIEADADPGQAQLEFGSPYVAKLANVAHRTELGAVRLDVSREDLPSAVLGLRKLAGENGVPAQVAVQPMLPFQGEALIGVHGTELGPIVVFGLGGVLVEALNRVGGRMAPFDLEEARALIDEFRDLELMHGYRGRAAWDLEELARILVNTGRLASAASCWLASLDLNPMLHGEQGYSVVDALLLLEPGA